MIIETKSLAKSYGSVDVLNGIDLSVPEGSAFALVGTNGAGKTTTMRILVNMIRPDEGWARVLNTDTRALTPKMFERIGYVSENQLLPERLTVGQYFDFLRAIYPGWDRGLETSLRRQFDLPPKRMLSKLSHGMRMKTVLVAGISFRPKLLILDEPLTGMDTLTRDDVVDGLLQQADETTILISSHELAEIENFTSHIAFMNNGSLLFQESVDSLRSRFREVCVTLSNQKEIPATLPNGWLAPEISGHSLRFVHSGFETDERLYQELSSLFGAIQFDTDAMSLRAISNALIRGTRGEHSASISGREAA